MILILKKRKKKEKWESFDKQFLQNVEHQTVCYLMLVFAFMLQWQSVQTYDHFFATSVWNIYSQILVIMGKKNHNSISWCKQQNIWNQQCLLCTKLFLCLPIRIQHLIKPHMNNFNTIISRIQCEKKNHYQQASYWNNKNVILKSNDFEFKLRSPCSMYEKK